MGSVTTREAAQRVAGSSGSLCGSEGSIPWYQDTVMSTVGAIGTMKSTPLRPVATTRTPAGGVKDSLAVFPVISPLTLASWVATSGAGSPRSSVVSVTLSVFAGSQAGTAWAAAAGTHTRRQTARHADGRAGKLHVPTRSIPATYRESDFQSRRTGRRAVASQAQSGRPGPRWTPPSQRSIRGRIAVPSRTALPSGVSS